MALINCPECGKEVSDKASTCINCGCPINQSGENIVNEPAVTVVESVKQKANKKFFTAMILNACAGGVLSVMGLISMLINSTMTPETVDETSNAPINITLTFESLSEYPSLEEFILDIAQLILVIFAIGFAFSVLAYATKKTPKKIFAIGSIIFSIIGCLFYGAIALSSAYVSNFIICTVLGTLYFISALMTVFGLKESFGKKC